MTEAPDDLLLVQLICFELHAPHELHDAVVVQPVLAGEDGLRRGTLLQPMKLARLKKRLHKMFQHRHL